VSLATRCVSCGTVFRVVQDQLRVSSGWVRCGRCGEVFNAIESLVDLEVDRPGEAPAPSVHGARVMEDLARVTAVDDAELVRSAARSESALGPGLEKPEPADRPLNGEPSPPPAYGDGPGQVEPPDDSLEYEIRTNDDTAHQGLHAPAPSDAEASDRSEPQLQPAFVRQANRAARWRHPGARAALGAASALALLGLVWQVNHTHHDWVAARWPALAPALDQVCRRFACRLEPPRLIEALTVESSGLVRDDKTNSYRLQMVLRNRQSIALMMPAVELVMSDATGAVILRRVLPAGTLGSSADRIAPNAEVPLSIDVRVSKSPVVGYTIELFYP